MDSFGNLASSLSMDRNDAGGDTGQARRDEQAHTPGTIGSVCELAYGLEFLRLAILFPLGIGTPVGLFAILMALLRHRDSSWATMSSPSSSLNTLRGSNISASLSRVQRKAFSLEPRGFRATGWGLF